MALYIAEFYIQKVRLISKQLISNAVHSNLKSSLGALFVIVILFYASKSDTMREEPDMIIESLLIFMLSACFI